MEESIHWPTEVASHFEGLHADKGLRVFSMRDFGSRAKNMDGPNSDVDAMFLFDQPASAHKRLGEYIDTIDPSEPMYGVDLHGWNLQKFADLLADSNPQAIEFLQSETKYYPEDHDINVALNDLADHALTNFNPIRLYYHYQSMAESNYKKYILRKLQHTNGDRYRIRSEYNEGYVCTPIDSPDEGTYYIYEGNTNFEELTTDRTVRRNLKVARAALYARHIRQTKSLPPMDFEEFLTHNVPQDTFLQVTKLLERKRNGHGDDIAGNPLGDLIEEEITHEPDNEALNQDGIDRERVNCFIDQIDAILHA